MADSTNPAALPDGFDAYLGYADGRWPDYQTIAAKFGGKPVYALSVFGTDGVGGGVDNEAGDATTAQAAAYIKREIAASVDRPIGYCPESWAASLVAECNAIGIPRSSWRLLTGHYATVNGQPWAHICGPSTCGCPVQADGTQWVDHGPYDESLLDDNFIGGTRPAPHPAPVPEEDDMPYIIESPSHGFAVVDSNTRKEILDSADGSAYANAGFKVVKVSDAEFVSFPVAGSAAEVTVTAPPVTVSPTMSLKGTTATMTFS